MPSHTCETAGCAAPATFRQLQPVDPVQPTYLCAEHWNKLRILHPDHSSLYGSLKVLGPVEEGEE